MAAVVAGFEVRLAKGFVFVEMEFPIIRATRLLSETANNELDASSRRVTDQEIQRRHEPAFLIAAFFRYDSLP